MDLPYELVVEDKPKLTKGGSYIAEVHPAFAIWLWCRKRMRTRKNWNYKKNVSLVKPLWRTIARVLLNEGCIEEILSRFVEEEPGNDDELDARVSWLLGTVWVRRAANRDGMPLARMLGNQHTGCMLLPNVSGLETVYQLTSKN